MIKNNKYIAGISMAILLLLSNGFNTYAQFIPPDLPCDPDDASCPLDTWVILLVAIALIFTTLHLYRKQKLAGQTA